MSAELAKEIQYRQSTIRRLQVEVDHIFLELTHKFTAPTIEEATVIRSREECQLIIDTVESWNPSRHFIRKVGEGYVILLLQEVPEVNRFVIRYYKESR